jgi:type I restriction enzyme S subunit
MEYQPYPEYKDSGVEWLGKIPNHWQDIRLKYVAALEGEKIEQGSSLKYVGMENIVSGNGKYLAKEDTNPESLSTSFSKGDVLFGKLRPYLAKSWLAEFSGICSSEFLVLRSKKVCPQFLNYYTLTDEFINQVDSSTYGSKMPRASWEFISLMDVPVPLDKESEIIAKFLDHETAKIDTLIEKQQQLIKLLKEKRQAVISHAVSKGLNPNVPMKESGVEWLGEVPEHWDVNNINYVLNAIGDVDHYMPQSVEKGIPYVMTGDLKECKRPTVPSNQAQ